MHIRMVLICFEAITSLKVNLGKSQVVPIGEVDTIASLVDILCFRLGSLLMEKKLYGWKRLDLSKGRRL